jgi:hypothetical protein
MLVGPDGVGWAAKTGFIVSGEKMGPSALDGRSEIDMLRRMSS